MLRIKIRLLNLLSLCCLCFVLGGCSGDDSDSTAKDVAANKSNLGSEGNIDGDDSKSTSANSKSSNETTGEKKRKPKKLTLGSIASGSKSEKKASDKNSSVRFDGVLDAMKPLQVLLGQWRGTTSKAFQGFKAVDQLNWVWDFKTNQTQPALVMTSDKSPYFRSGRLTYLTDSQEFQLVAKDKEGKELEYRGSFSAEPQDVPGDDKKLQRTYKLKLTQVSAESAKEAWQVVLNQQENNRYLMELYRSRNGGEFFRRDTVGTQREGTSFAIDDSDYKEKTCVISEGLGTIQVSHDGKSYWVCCTGCKAAFEEDPERWVAKFNARQKEKMKEEK